MSSAHGDRQTAIAPAKVNLTLRIRGTRADGYHELESVVVKITVYDGIDVFAGGHPAVTISCTDPAVPVDSRNTICQVIRLLADRAPGQNPLRVALHKRIPVGAGMGGGSSDAAAVLQLLNRRWALGLGRSEMGRLAARVGSDVPLFLEPSSVVVTGRGEVVQPVGLRFDGWLVLVLPPFAVATRTVYRAWDPHMRRAGVDPRTCLEAQYDNAEALSRVLFNDLETSVYRVEPRLKQINDRLEEVTGRKFHVTGSGSTLFTCQDTHEAAEQLGLRIGQEMSVRTQLARVINLHDNE